MIKNKKKLQDLANNVANVTLELMYDNTDWMLSGYEQESDDYNEIHAYVMSEAIKILYKQNK
tara:strand:+ start:446 stop:631 length:186 start_codon:yes stop_codon:yes gene_type:complete